MDIKSLHAWNLSITEAKKLQLRLAGNVSVYGDFSSLKLVAGVDISTRKHSDTATGAVVVLSHPELEIIEVRIVEGKLGFPYIPGYLSFRELPIILSACEQLTVKPDLFLVDGQGIAHPRRFGLASHLGVFLDTSAIGCAKSLLYGSYETPEEEAGDYSYIRDNGEIIGAALRTKSSVKPVYVSIGHKTGLRTAVDLVLKCAKGYRLPEPTRLAHQAAGGSLSPKKPAFSAVR